MLLLLAAFNRAAAPYILTTDMMRFEEHFFTAERLGILERVVGGAANKYLGVRATANAEPLTQPSRGPPSRTGRFHFWNPCKGPDRLPR